MEITISNTNTKAQRVMILSANKAAVDNEKSIQEILSAYQFYEMEQPPLSREHAELEENTDSILDFLQIDLENRIMFQGYNPRNNTDKAIAAQVRKLADTLMAIANKGEDITFNGTDTYNPDANIVGFYQANLDGNPTLELKWYSNNSAYYDSATVIGSEIGHKIEGVDADGVLNLTDIDAIIIEEADGTSYLVAQDYEDMNDDNGDFSSSKWADIIAEHVDSLDAGTLYYSIAEYDR